MLKALLYSCGLLLVFALGFLVSNLQNPAAFAQAKQISEKPAYLVASATILHPDQMQPYLEAAGPLAEKAGLQMLASGISDSTVHVLEGQWPYGGIAVVEKYTSMDALLSFWNSAEYQAAKKLREGHMDVNFIIAVEAVE